MAYQHLVVTIEKNISIITFNRPEVLNALSRELLSELSDALDAVHDNPDIRVLILTGSGDKAFVAGADISELATFTPLETKLYTSKSQIIINKLQDLSIPVIGAVNGFALGGGTEIALACDFVYASENAMFGQPEINLGLIPGFGGTQRLPRLIGTNRAKEMIFTGKMINAQEAKEMGLANQVFPQSALMEAVMKTAKNIASKGKVSIRAAKEVINRGMNVDLNTGCLMEIDAFSLCIASADAKEGTTAFLEKRTANFRGGLEG